MLRLLRLRDPPPRGSGLARENAPSQGVIAHHESEVAELRADRDLAVAYLKAAMESLNDPVLKTVGMRILVEPENHAHA